MICENLNFDVEIEGILFILMDMWMVYVKEVIEIFEENFGDCVFVLCIKKIVCFVEVFVVFSCWCVLCSCVLLMRWGLMLFEWIIIWCGILVVCVWVFEFVGSYFLCVKDLFMVG